MKTLDLDIIAIDKLGIILYRGMSTKLSIIIRSIVIELDSSPGEATPTNVTFCVSGTTIRWSDRTRIFASSVITYLLSLTFTVIEDEQ
jgi:hypothetical protein